jgi:hypothetical protein
VVDSVVVCGGESEDLIHHSDCYRLHTSGTWTQVSTWVGTVQQRGHLDTIALVGTVPQRGTMTQFSTYCRWALCNNEVTWTWVST